MFDYNFHSGVSTLVLLGIFRVIWGRLGRYAWEHLLVEGVPSAWGKVSEGGYLEEGAWEMVPGWE